ncbi:hypothetical protein P4699_20350 [Priestia aryabhattai]|uniref:hypothetical protein n=1 Tax=Priestia aryabhattai TaxID=412384 RepID=UPI002E1BFBB1|nr:hypothetical protein [Priestia aryabhattai]
MSKKVMWQFVLLSVIIMILFPIITNGLMLVGNFKVAGDSQISQTWIGYLGSFWGAILGGVISGAITLIGVRLTIHNQDRQEFIRLYPQRKIALDNYLTLSGNTMDFLIKAFRKDRSAINQGQVFKKIDELAKELQDSLKEIAKVDGESYNYSKGILQSLLEIKSYISKDYFADSQDSLIEIHGYYVVNKSKYDEVIKNIDSFINKLDIINNQLDKKYNNVTGSY